MLRRTISFLCSQSVSHGRTLLRRCQALDLEIEVANEKLKQLRDEVETFFILGQTGIIEAQHSKQANSLAQIPTYQRCSQRGRVLEDCQKVRMFLVSKSQAFRKQAVQNFAKSLVKLSDSLKSVKASEKDDHELDLKEGFDLTSRLFFNTLEKFKILNFSPQPKTKFNKEQMIIQSEIKAENEKEKGLVAKVIQPGYIAEGKVIQKAKIQIYI